ncbi:hypothetical protein BGV45_25850 [Serratia marcescens]|nr:hypothetical protein BGV45_25850 [Serratia marcescens]
MFTLKKISGRYTSSLLKPLKMKIFIFLKYLLIKPFLLKMLLPESLIPGYLPVISIILNTIYKIHM